MSRISKIFIIIACISYVHVYEKTCLSSACSCDNGFDFGSSRSDDDCKSCLPDKTKKILLSTDDRKSSVAVNFFNNPWISLIDRLSEEASQPVYGFYRFEFSSKNDTIESIIKRE